MLLYLLAAVLVVLAVLASMSEVALTRTSRVTLEHLLRERRRGSAQLATIVRDPARYLNTLLLVRIGCEVGASVLVAVQVVATTGSTGTALAIVLPVMTAVVYVVVGVGPRTLGRQHATGVALAAAPVTTRLTLLLGPLPRLLIVLGNAITPGKGYRDGPFASEAELRDLVDLATERQVIDATERDMVDGVFELGDTLAREVMVPRPDVIYVEQTKTVRQVLALALRSGFSRIPVTGDGIDDVIGVAYLKDLARLSADHRDGDRVATVMRPVSFVPDTVPVDRLLRTMQAQRVHMALCIDEYGGTAGLVTIEDILEEIVGEIADEYDREGPPVQEQPDGTVRVTARLPVEDLAELFDVEIVNDDVETVGGLLAAELGRVPIPGARVEVQGLELVAESASGRRNRIDTVLVRRLSEPGQDAPRNDAEPRADQQPPAPGAVRAGSHTSGASAA